MPFFDQLKIAMLLEGLHGFSVETAALRWGDCDQLDRRLGAMFSLEPLRCVPPFKPTDEVPNSQWNGNDEEERPHDA